MPIFTTLAATLPFIKGAFDIARTALDKPRKEDFVPQGGFYERYLNFLKGKRSEQTIFHQLMRPALRTIGAQTRKAQRGVEFAAARDRPGGGIVAQQRLSINKQALAAIGEATERATLAQQRVNRQTGERLLQIGIQEERALQQFRIAERQHKRALFTTIGGTVINIASTLIGQKLQAQKEAGELAKLTLQEQQSTYNDLISEGLVDPKKYSFADHQATLASNQLPFVGTPGQKGEALGKFLKTEEAKQATEFTRSSIEALGQFQVELKGLKDPSTALALLDSFKENLSNADFKTAIESAVSALPEPADPNDKLIVDFYKARADENITKANDLLTKIFATETDPTVIRQITQEMSELRTLQRAKAAKDVTEMTAAEKKIETEKDKGLVLQNDMQTLQSLISRAGITYPGILTPAEKSVERLNALTAQFGGEAVKIAKQGDRGFESAITTLGGVNIDTGMSLAEATGIKRAISKAISARKVGEFEDATLKELATLEKQLLERVDALFEKRPFEDFTNLLDQTIVP